MGDCDVMLNTFLYLHQTVEFHHCLREELVIHETLALLNVEGRLELTLEKAIASGVNHLKDVNNFASSRHGTTSL
jgi:hypothetical protein